MKKKVSAVAFILILILSEAAAILFVNLASAHSFGTITIKADGSIDPATAPISTNDNVTYTLTDDIYFNISLNMIWCIRVERFNIILDGAGHTIQGNGSGRGIEISNPYGAPIRERYDVTVTNINVKGFDTGIGVYGGGGDIINGVVIAANNVTNNNIGITFSSYSLYSNNTIIGNNITLNNRGIDIKMAQEGGSVSGNTITGNQIANNNIGMYFLWKYSLYGGKSNPLQMNNTIFHNNFVNNTQNVVNGQDLFSPKCANIWDNNGIGNYWSSYNGTDANNDGIGDTPYVIDGNNQDNYPLMTPYKEPEVKETQPEPFPTAIVATASGVSVTVIGIGVLVYFKKRKH